MWPNGWRIKERKLNFVRQILWKDDENIAKQTLQQEMAIGLNGLAHECNNICNEINIPEITNNNVLFKRQITRRETGISPGLKNMFSRAILGQWHIWSRGFLFHLLLNLYQKIFWKTLILKYVGSEEAEKNIFIWFI